MCGITWNRLADCILRSEAGMLREGIQGTEADALCSSVNNDIWYQRSGVALYRICIFLSLQVTVEEVGNLHNL